MGFDLLVLYCVACTCLLPTCLVVILVGGFAVICCRRIAGCVVDAVCCDFVDGLLSLVAWQFVCWCLCGTRARLVCFGVCFGFCCLLVLVCYGFVVSAD